MQQKYLQCHDRSCVTTATQLHRGLTEGKEEWCNSLVLWQYLRLHPRGRYDPWTCVLYSPLEHCSRSQQTGCYPTERRKKNTSVMLTEMRWQISNTEKSQLMNLQYLVMTLKVFIFIRIKLRKLIDVDPKLLDLFSDLEHTSTVQ